MMTDRFTSLWFLVCVGKSQSRSLDGEYHKNTNAAKASHNAAVSQHGRFAKNPLILKRAPKGYVFDPKDTGLLIAKK